MRLSVLPIMVLLALPATAAETPWQDVAPGVRLRVVTSDVLKPDHTTMAALEIDMPANTKTYWRVPGETGIPTEMDLSGSTGIADHRILWPYPRIDSSAGFVDFVYYGPTVLPVELTMQDDSGELKAAVTMGICSDVCIPVRAEFTLGLAFDKPDRAEGLRIAQALALTPMDWTDPREPLGTVSYDAAANALAVGLSDPQVDPMSLIAASEVGGQLFGAPQKSPDGLLVLLPLLGGKGDTDVQGKPVQLTFMTEMGPFVVSRRVAPAESTAGGQ